MTGIDFNFVAVHIVVLGRSVIIGFTPGNLNTAALGEVVTGTSAVMYLEYQIFVVGTILPVGILDNYIFEGKLFTG